MSLNLYSRCFINISIHFPSLSYFLSMPYLSPAITSMALFQVSAFLTRQITLRNHFYCRGSKLSGIDVAKYLRESCNSKLLAMTNGIESSVLTSENHVCVFSCFQFKNSNAT